MGVLVLWKKTAVVLYPSFYLCNYLFCSREQPGTPTKYNGEVVNWVRNTYIATKTDKNLIFGKELQGIIPGFPIYCKVVVQNY